VTKLLSVKNLIALVAFTSALVVVSADKSVVKADDNSGCEDNYGGGQTCLVNKRFDIKKEVRVCDSKGNNCGDWKSKVTDVSKNDIVEFRITIKNKSDDAATKLTGFNDMEMKDKLPSEMTRTGGDGLTEYFDNFDPGDTRHFVIKSQVDSSEFNHSGDFEKCVVNKATVYWNGKSENSDTATVCYGKNKLTELPKTGTNTIVALVGVGLLVAGIAISLSKKFAAK
jgi:LPXTG-motif cell wall-anchored protein